MADLSAFAASTAARSQATSPPSTREGATSNAPPRIRRRNRVIASCLECRRRKLKCDKLAPCTNCIKFRRDCLYLAPTLDPTSQQKLAEIKDKMGTLEQTLERDVARRASADQSGHIKTEDLSDEEDYQEAEDEKDLEPTPLAAIDQVYENDADDEIMDLGVILGKMRVSDRIGGFVRPKMAEEMNAYPDRGIRRASSTVASPPSMLNNLSSGHWLTANSPAAFLGPGPDYIAPASGFFFPPSTYQSALSDYLPSRNVCDRLLQHYWVAVHPVATIVHKPTFEKLYVSFWTHIAVGTEPPASMQALVFAAMLMASVSLSDSWAMQQFDTPRVSLVERFQSITETSLSRAGFLRTTKLDTMQAFVMYLIPLCRSEISRAHSALTGTAIRLAECMGLHRDGSLYGFSAVETHVRRLIWYHLCFLDIRTCEATGPRPQIRREDFDTQLPLNINEVDLLKSNPPTEDSAEWTDMTLSRIRFECTELHRRLWIDMPRIDQKKVKLTAVLGKIQKFRAEMEAKYMHLMQAGGQIQSVALKIYRVLSGRPYIMVLHRYTPMPDRLRKIHTEACLAVNENSVALDTQPEVALWSWCRGCFQQYQSSMLLMLEVYHNPSSPYCTRVWKCLDHIFELSPDTPSAEKAEYIVAALRERLQVYQSLRKQKVQTRVEDEQNKKHFNIRNDIPQPSNTNTPMSGEENNFTQYSTPSSSSDMPAAAHMNPMQFNFPPLAPSSSDGASPFAFPLSNGDTQMAGNVEIDWDQWDQYFPAEEPADFGNVELPDFYMGSFNMYPSFDGEQKWRS